ncbi:MAG: LPS export ABC transporter permease LptG [Burkholderiaceae bacterium]
MRTVRRLLYSDIVSSVGFVALSFLSLFFFIDFVDELADIGPSGYTSLHAALASMLKLPGRLYELAPIVVLIGTIYALARLAHSSEYTILRTGGLGPGRALGLLASLGLMFGVATYAVGDHIAPLSERQATSLKAKFRGGLSIGGSGAWLKDHARTAQGERSYSINVRSAPQASTLKDVRIFEFDADGRLLKRLYAASAEIDDAALWQLDDVQVTHWEAAGAATGAKVLEEHLARVDWPSTLTAAVVAAALLPANNMSTLDLFRYIAHLDDNEQAAQRHQIQFWKRALYPFSCLVMMALALPFAYMHARAGGVSLKVFGGIMLGISFVLQNNLAGHLGLLRNWSPWIAAAAPTAIYLLLSLAAFAWLVRYR